MCLDLQIVNIIIYSNATMVPKNVFAQRSALHWDIWLQRWATAEFTFMPHVLWERESLKEDFRSNELRSHDTNCMRILSFPTKLSVLLSQWDVFTIRFYSRGNPFPGCHCGANRPSLSKAVHSFRSCRGRRASFLGRKSSNKSISNLMEALATQPEGWTCSILKEPCV